MKNVAWLFVLCGIAASSARAADDTAKVRALFDSATAHYNLGEYRQALDDYKTAYRIRRDPSFLFNIGQCYRQLGEPAAASREYRAYLREAPDARNRDEVIHLVENMDRAAAEKEAQKPPTGTQQPKVALPPTAPEPAQPPQRPSRTWLWVTLGVVAVVLIAGGIGLGVGLSESTAEPTSRFGTFSAVFR